MIDIMISPSWLLAESKKNDRKKSKEKKVTVHIDLKSHFISLVSRPIGNTHALPGYRRVSTRSARGVRAALRVIAAEAARVAAAVMIVPLRHRHQVIDMTCGGFLITTG